MEGYKSLMIMIEDHGTDVVVITTSIMPSLIELVLEKKCGLPLAKERTVDGFLYMTLFLP